MQNYIFEGMPTSGKTTLTNLIAQKLARHNKVVVLGEDVTVIPTVEDPVPLKVRSYLGRILALAIDEQPDVILTDRFHISQAHRLGIPLQYFAGIERRLLAATEPLTVFLNVCEDSVPARIQHALGHRGLGYRDFIYSKNGTTLDEVAANYVDQQRARQELVEASELPYVTYDTTVYSHQTYEAIARDVVARQQALSREPSGLATF